ncbi:unnamed protein product, partial [Symbiodinium sp. CCMP2456]
DWHYDAVVPSGVAKGRKQKGQGGYDLSGRKPAPDHLAKTKYALDEGRMPPWAKADGRDLLELPTCDASDGAELPLGELPAEPP